MRRDAGEDHFLSETAETGTYGAVSAAFPGTQRADQDFSLRIQMAHYRPERGKTQIRGKTVKLKSGLVCSIIYSVKVLTSDAKGDEAF